MKMKKWIALLLAGSMMLSLAACGGKDDSSENASTDQSVIDNVDQSVVDDIPDDGVWTDENIDENTPSDPTGDFIVYGNIMSGDEARQWINVYSNGYDLVHWMQYEHEADARYATLMREIYSAGGKSIALAGTVNWLDRSGDTGAGTVMLITDTWGNVYSATSADTMEVTTGDKISVMGVVKGEGGYESTNMYGMTSEYSCPWIEIYDWYFTEDGRFPAEERVPDISTTIQLTPPVIMAQDVALYYYNRAMSAVDSFSTTEINGHPYTVSHYYEDQTRCRYCIFIRYDEIEYGDGEYNLLTIDMTGMSILPPNSEHFYESHGGVDPDTGCMMDSRLTADWGNVLLNDITTQ